MLSNSPMATIGWITLAVLVVLTCSGMRMILRRFPFRRMSRFVDLVLSRNFAAGASLRKRLSSQASAPEQSTSEVSFSD